MNGKYPCIAFGTLLPANGPATFAEYAKKERIVSAFLSIWGWIFPESNLKQRF